MLIQILTFSVLQYNRISYGARLYIYSKGHYQKVNLIALAEGYKKAIETYF